MRKLYLSTLFNIIVLNGGEIMIQLRIDEILKEKGLSKYWLNKQLGMCYRNFSNLINNETTSVRFDTLEKLSTILNVPVGELFKQTLDDSTNTMSLPHNSHSE